MFGEHSRPCLLTTHIEKNINSSTQTRLMHVFCAQFKPLPKVAVKLIAGYLVDGFKGAARALLWAK